MSIPMKPLLFCGKDQQGTILIGGTFQLADSYGFPLSCSIQEAEERGMSVNLAHYFLSAIEHGWDDRQTFDKMKEAFIDINKFDEDKFAKLKTCCKQLLLISAHRSGLEDPRAIGKWGREYLESKP